MVKQQPERVIVYRGFDAGLLDMVEGRLREEGLEPIRLGRSRPELLGIGTAALEQMIEVPAAMAEEARRLIEAIHAKPDAKTLSELERQATEAAPVRERQAAPVSAVDIRYVLFVILVGAVVYALMR